MNKKTLLMLLAIMLVGFFFRAYGINSNLFWQDEAETVLQAEQVLLDGYPGAYYKGLVVHENTSFIESKDSEKYAFASSNFYPNDVERRKGWLTYFFLAPLVKAFGVNEIALRLPFILLSLISIFLVFAFAKEFIKSEKAALACAFLYAINFPAYGFEGEARYYALETLFLLASLYFLYLFFSKKRHIYFYWFVFFAFLEFNVHIIISGILLAFFALYYWVQNKKLDFYKNVRITAPLAIFLLLSVPWLLAVGFWNNFLYGDANLLKNFGLAFFLFGPFLLIYYAEKRLGLVFFNFKDNNYLFLFIAVYLAVSMILLPSNILRIFYPLMPLAIIFFVKLALDLPKKKASVFMMMLIGLILMIPLWIKYEKSISVRGSSNWVGGVIEFLDKDPKLSRYPVFVSYQDLVFRVYSDYQTELIWPIGESYFSDPTNEFILVINKRQFWYNNTWIHPEDSTSRLNISERIRWCNRSIISDQVSVYFCPNYQKAL